MGAEAVIFYCLQFLHGVLLTLHSGFTRLSSLIPTLKAMLNGRQLSSNTNSTLQDNEISVPKHLAIMFATKSLINYVSSLAYDDL